MWIADDLFKDDEISERQTIFEANSNKINKYLIEQGLPANLRVECEEMGLVFCSTEAAVAYFRIE